MPSVRRHSLQTDRAYRLSGAVGACVGNNLTGPQVSSTDHGMHLKLQKIMNSTPELSPPTENKPAASRFGAFWFALRMIEVRLRFVAVLVGIGLTIGYWDTLQNYWDRWTRPPMATTKNMTRDTEFYCPMDPSVVRDSLEPNGSVPKCPICGMPLSLRKKGAPMILPPGVVGRVSLTPNRINMAGIRTSEVGLRPMAQSIRTVGTVVYNESMRSQIVSRVGGYVEKLYVDKTFSQVNQGDALAAVYSPELYAAVQELRVASGIAGSGIAKIAREKIRLLGIDESEIDSLIRAGDGGSRVIIRSPTSGVVIQKSIQQGSNVAAGQMLFEVANLSSVWIEAEIYERDLNLLKLDQAIEATVEAYPQQMFKGYVSLIYPELNAATRTNRVRFEVANPSLMLRAGMYATVKLETPLQQIEPYRTVLTSSKDPAIDPELAISKQSICPVTHAKLGSMGEPVAVKASGHTIYLCCANCEPAINRDPEKYLARIRTVSDEGVLSVPESAVIDTGNQKVVYVEREEGVYEGVEVQLGPRSNGYYAVVSGLLPGDKVAAAGAFLIDAETRLNPAASASYFGASGGPGATNAASSDQSIGDASGANQSTQPSTESTPPPAAETIDFQTSRLSAAELEEIGALSPQDQLLAKEQVLCPVTMKPLGSMGKPQKVMVGNQSVFVCCPACIKRVQQDGEAMLEMVARWREANKQPQGAAK